MISCLHVKCDRITLAASCPGWKQQAGFIWCKKRSGRWKNSAPWAADGCLLLKTNVASCCPFNKLYVEDGSFWDAHLVTQERQQGGVCTVFEWGDLVIWLHWWVLLIGKVGSFFPGKQEYRDQSLWPWETLSSWHWMFGGCVVMYGKLFWMEVHLPIAGHVVVVIQKPPSYNSTSCEFSGLFENWQMHLPCLWGSLSFGLYTLLEAKMIW